MTLLPLARRRRGKRGWEAAKAGPGDARAERGSVRRAASRPASRCPHILCFGGLRFRWKAASSCLPIASTPALDIEEMDAVGQAGAGRENGKRRNIMQRVMRNVCLSVLVGTTIAAAQIPPEVAGTRCDGQSNRAECWQKLVNHPECYYWTDYFDRDSKFSWTGECRSGLASGKGSLEWERALRPESGRQRKARSVTVHRGALKKGKKDGWWFEGSSDGLHGISFQGAYVEGKKQGQWVENFWGHTISEGPYVHGKRHGYWVTRFSGGARSEGPYVEGKEHGRWISRDRKGNERVSTYVEGEVQ